jgi:hypothetical protein
MTAFTGRLTIHIASSKDGIPLAGIVTLPFQGTLFYKYGASDASYHHLGGMPFLFWRVIQQAKAAGFTELDLGRSDRDQAGLIAFKEHLGATGSPLTYYRWPPKAQRIRSPQWASRVARGVFSHLPDATLDLAGRLLYRHLG